MLKAFIDGVERHPHSAFAKYLRELKYGSSYFLRIYTTSVFVFLGCNKPELVGTDRGDMSIDFSCHPDLAEALVDASLDEIEHFQAEGPSVANISANSAFRCKYICNTRV
ncbi:hypothetical protein LXL04_038903 [Taraxacum kok-saghyz]